MNNLLRALSDSQLNSTARLDGYDLKQLLSTVKEGRGQENRLSDAFYDSLEGLLHDLRTVSVDNQDAEAFLKPVTRAEVHDYYDVISNPMDLQTMMKKVKNKNYRSKREFKDDLDLIWSNCRTYNASENHPLRACVARLEVKANALLKHITDRKERTDPQIPHAFSSTVTTNPKINGHVHTNGHGPALNGHVPNGVRPGPRISLNIGSNSVKLGRITPFSTAQPKSKRHIENDTALVRTPDGMQQFTELSQQVDKYFFLPRDDAEREQDVLVRKLRAITLDSEDEEAEDSPEEHSSTSAGMKRAAPNHGSNRPRKRTRIAMSPLLPVAPEDDQVTKLWWRAVQSDRFFANALPPIAVPSSSHTPSAALSSSSSWSKPHNTTEPPDKPKRPRRRKKLQPEQNSMLHLMNNNIKTMRRIRHTHGKFVSLGFGAGGEDTIGEDGSGPSATAGPSLVAPAWEDVQGEDENDRIDERKWRLRSSTKGKEKATRSGVEMGLENSTDCVNWTTMKILEHSGFQGSSSVALEVLTGVVSEYLMNVGRTIKYLTDTSKLRMTPEEIVLHTLFESGVSRVDELSRYLQDDVERYGSRLGDLERKLVGAYRETVSKIDANAVEEVEDEGLFESSEEEGETTNVLARGDFADDIGVDFFGFKEMGIMEEFGLASLSIPRSLLKGNKKRTRRSGLKIAKPKEPPPPYPPPPPLVLLKSSGVDREVIGLLKPYFRERMRSQMQRAKSPPAVRAPSANPYPTPQASPFAPPSLSGPVLQPHLPLPAPSLLLPPPGPSIHPGSSLPSPTPQQPQQPQQQQLSQPASQLPAIASPVDADVELPDDTPQGAQVKMGPLGQIQVQRLTSKALSAHAAGGAAATGKKGKVKVKPIAIAVAPPTAASSPTQTNGTGINSAVEANQMMWSGSMNGSVSGSVNGSPRKLGPGEG